jgi:hypothetical protein
MRARFSSGYARRSSQDQRTGLLLLGLRWRAFSAQPLSRPTCGRVASTKVVCQGPDEGVGVDV